MSSKPSRENVKVVCRIRPETKQERERQGSTCVKFNKTAVEVTLDEGTHNYSFDQIFGPDSKQQDVFDYCAVPLVNDVLQGYNATIFAYGQTSSGKTFTMEGTDIRDETYKGIIPRAIEALFAGVSEADENIEFCFKVSYVDIYMEKIRDLLDSSIGRTNLAIREDKQRGVYIEGVIEEYVTSEDELLQILSTGRRNRIVAATNMVSQRDVSKATTKSGKLVLVDLAGSETVRKTNASGQQLEEGKTISKSISALRNVVYALGEVSHVPYRDSKLTRILQDSVGGNAKTSVIVTCSPSSYNSSETVLSLRFGMKAKSIQNRPVKNETRSVEAKSIQNQVVKNETRSVKELETLLEKAERAIDAQSGHIMALVAQLQGYIDSGDEPTTSGQHAGVDNSVLIEKLQDLQTASGDKIMEWAAGFKGSKEVWFAACEEKIKALDQLLVDSKKQVQDLEAHKLQQLEQSANNIRQQAERYIAELTDLRAQIQEIKVEYAQRLESGSRGEMGSSKVILHQGPEVIRGGQGQQEGTEKPASPTISKSIRGGGRKEKTESDVDPKDDVKHDDSSSNEQFSSL